MTSHLVRRSVLLMTLSLLTVLPRGAAGEPGPVWNSTTPAGGMRRVELEEMWRIGGPDDEENLLGVIDQAYADSTGQVYLVDIQLNEVQVFDRDGEYVKTLGRQGDGPGEVRRLSDLVFLPDGNLGLIQSFPGRIVKITPEGEPAGELKLGSDEPQQGGFYALISARTVGDELVLAGRRMSRRENTRVATSFISRYDQAGTPLAAYLELTRERDFTSGRMLEAENWSPVTGGWALTAEGQVIAAAGRNGYRLQVYRPGGQVTRVFGRDYTPYRRTDEEIARIQGSARRFGRRNRPAPEIVVEPTEPDITELVCRMDGRIWVLPSRGNRDQQAGIHSTWDVFDAEGRFVEQVAFACDGDGQRDALFLAGGDLAILVREHAGALDALRGISNEDEAAEEEDVRPLEVVCYRIPR